MKINWHIGILVAAFVLTGCGGGSSGSDSSGDSGSPGGDGNTAPVADAGDNQNVTSGDTVTLDGSASSDPDGDMLSYDWTFASTPSGSSAQLSDADTATPTFTADADGNYTVQLTVSDGTSESETDSVEVVAAADNSAPMADAGPDQNVETGTTVTLDGSGSSDADGDNIDYNWSFTSRPSGSSATLDDASAASPSFTADLDGEYVVQLVVNDGTADSDPDQLTVIASTSNSAPVADAGADQNVVAGDTVSLDGSASSDADGDSLAYDWRFVSVPSGSSAALVDADTASPEFTADATGDYVVELIVNDGTTDSGSDRVTVSAAAANSAPQADAGTNQSVATGQTVTLDGSGSGDADGDMITYSWSFVSRPSGSSASLNDPTSVSPSFTADVDGDYVVELVVNDGSTDSAADQVTVTAATANSAPTADAGPDQNVDTGVTVTLDGSGSSDPDGDSLSYSWTFVSTPGGSSASLTNAATANPAFTPDVAGDYVVELVVNDGSVDSAADRVTVTAATANSAPMADAGNDQSVATGDTVTLDGSGSSDADGDSLSYQWSFVSQPSGSSASLSGADTESPSFTADAAGDFVVRVEVNDGQGGTDSDTITVSAAVPAQVSLSKLNEASGSFESVGFPYSNSSSPGSVDASQSPITLATFRIKAETREITITDLSTSSAASSGAGDSTLDVFFSGIQNGDTISQGNDVEFTLMVNVGSGVIQFAAGYGFTAQESEESFSANFNNVGVR